MMMIGKSSGAYVGAQNSLHACSTQSTDRPPQIARTLRAPSTSGASAAAPPLLRTPTAGSVSCLAARLQDTLANQRRNQPLLIQAREKQQKQVGTHPSRRRCGRASMRAPRSAAGGPRRSRPDNHGCDCHHTAQHSSSRESDAIKSAVMAHIAPCKLTA